MSSYIIIVVFLAAAIASIHFTNAALRAGSYRSFTRSYVTIGMSVAAMNRHGALHYPRILCHVHFARHYRGIDLLSGIPPGALFYHLFLLELSRVLYLLHCSLNEEGVY